VRVIHCVPSVSEEASGPSYSIVRLCQSLIEEGVGVRLATLDWSPMQASLPFLERFPLGLGPRRLGRSPEMLQWLMNAAADSQADLIHNHSLWMMPNVYAGRVARKLDVPLMVSPRGTLSRWAFSSGSPTKRLFWPALQRPAIAGAACFHATAASELADIRRHGFGQPVAVIPNGVDIPQAVARSTRPARTLLFLGRIHPIKGLDLLIPAWAAIQDEFPQWRLRIVGSDHVGYLKAVRKQASDMGVRRVSFEGPVSGDAKWTAFHEADLFVLPSHSENFGVAAAEALASGIPAVVTRAAPWQGLQERGAGWWVETSIDGVAQGLKDAMRAEPAQLERMGALGRDWMREQYSWEAIGGMMRLTYEWLTRGGPRPAWVHTN
jgi:glycosyltransferase involved in cell wall biosynthesis